jgi:hypothetical protein
MRVLQVWQKGVAGVAVCTAAQPHLLVDLEPPANGSMVEAVQHTLMAPRPAHRLQAVLTLMVCCCNPRAACGNATHVLNFGACAVYSLNAIQWRLRRPDDVPVVAEVINAVIAHC